ncbi:hypothetical protein EJ05DRAFT_268612 [Pseudovirgaria hyperparasitica]|uniref:Up-regulated during septation protein 1 domain-containing protein n=1 Tax=Pseudovirgaria hyperparasitica TaxID=470096 RepID=A0A6A6VSZ2_9PEZI|nr:uncharacterized protein EJ05DRAFT_268612 [Pseudovirgaria hyperparasitica]KAF2752710.1 hypothetical protein EJ05DRAFT_268612 [Pseudovirgaria hyperparasitica]
MSMREHPDEAITRANVELYKASLCIQNCRTSILQLLTIRKEEKRSRMQVDRENRRLHVLCQEAVHDRNEIASKCQSLYRELGDAYTEILSHYALSENSDQASMTVKDGTRMTQLERENDKLQQQNSELQRALGIAADMIRAVRMQDSASETHGDIQVQL